MYPLNSSPSKWSFKFKFKFKLFFDYYSILLHSNHLNDYEKCDDEIDYQIGYKTYTFFTIILIDVGTWAHDFQTKPIFHFEIFKLTLYNLGLIFFP
jgi:hypothetical protein